MSDLRLVVNGIRYGGWKSIRVRRSLEECAGSYELGVSELWPEQTEPREIRTGDKSSIVIDGETVVTGFVDSTDFGFDSHSHGVFASGRDVTADLVDCSAQHGKGEWRNARLDQIARDLCAPFGIAVKVETDVGAAFPSWALQEGETCFECIERAARQRGVLLMSDGMGSLVLGQASTQRVSTALVQGENLLTCRASNNASERFRDYILKGQRAGSDDVSGEAASAMRATAQDTGVARPRTLVIVAEDETDLASLARRAKWEATVRAARGLNVNVSVNGWRHSNGLWRPNTLVRLTAPVNRLDRDLLVRDVDYLADDQGERTEMVLVPAEAYSLVKMPGKHKAPRRKRSKGGQDADDVWSPSP